MTVRTRWWAALAVLAVGAIAPSACVGDEPATADESDAASSDVASGDAIGDSGFSDVTVDAATVDAPRPMAPLSGARFSGSMTSFKWSLPAGVEGAHVDICKDRACATIAQSFDAPGTSGSPTTALAAGVYYWRIFGRTGGTIGASAFPATWEFRVGHSGVATHAASWGTMADFNGDGYEDLAAASGQNEPTASANIYVALGGASGLVLGASPIVAADDVGNVARAGDIDGDGFVDLAVGAPGAASQAGRVFIYKGSASGLASTASATIEAPPGADGGVDAQFFGFNLIPIGDVDGDGYADVAISSINYAAQVGIVYVYRGSATGLGAAPAYAVHSPSASAYQFGAELASAGDMNGDGYGDFVVELQGLYVPYLVLGGAAGPGMPMPLGGAYAPYSLAGDVDGDGLSDLAITEGFSDGSAGSSGFTIYSGSTSASALTVPDIARDLGAVPGPNGITAAGDFDADGHSDLVFSVSDATVASVWIFPGTGGIATMPAVTLTPPAAVGTGGTFGCFAVTGDYDGDGRDDLALASRDRNEVDVYYAKGSVLLSTTPNPLTVNLANQVALRGRSSRDARRFMVSRIPVML